MRERPRNEFTVRRVNSLKPAEFLSESSTWSESYVWWLPRHASEVLHFFDIYVMVCLCSTFISENK